MVVLISSGKSCGAERVTQQRSRKRSEKRRKYVLEAALATFAADGYQASMGEIARAAGITRTVLYYYFDSKKALFEAVFELQMAQLLQAVGPPAMGEGTPAERMRHIIRNLLEFARSKPEAWNLLFRQTDEAESDVFEVRLQTRVALRSAATAILAEDIEKAGIAPEGQSPEILFEMALGAFTSVIAWWQSNPDVSLAKVEETAIWLFAGDRSWL